MRGFRDGSRPFYSSVSSRRLPADNDDECLCQLIHTCNNRQSISLHHSNVNTICRHFVAKNGSISQSTRFTVGKTGSQPKEIEPAPRFWKVAKCTRAVADNYYWMGIFYDDKSNGIPISKINGYTTHTYCIMICKPMYATMHCILCIFINTTHYLINAFVVSVSCISISGN